MVANTHLRPRYPTPLSPDEDPIKTQLIPLTTDFINLHISRDLPGFFALDFFTPTFTNISPHRHVKALTMVEYVDQYEQYLEICPDFSVKILSMSGEVQGSGKASVMVDAEQGLGGGVKLPSFTVFSWRLQDGKWMCWKIECIRGSAGGIEGEIFGV